MIVPIFTMSESKSYDSMDNQKFNKLTQCATELISSAVSFHEDKRAFNSDTHVMVNIYSKRVFAVENPQTYDHAIIYYHGGGYCFRNSHICQLYLRKWANDLDVPIFAVDYILAPKNPYPDPVNDSYQAYVWILTQAKD